MTPLDKLLQKAKALNDEDKSSEAIALLPDSELEKFNNANLYTEIARAYFRLEEYERSNKYADKAIALNPKQAQANYYKGIFFRIIKEYDKAIEFCKKAIEVNPKYASPYNGLGNIYGDLNDYEKAIEYYKQAIEVDPQYANPYNGLGSTYFKLKNYEKSIGYYKIAIEVNPKYAISYSNLGLVYRDQKDYKKAVECYTKAIEINPAGAGPYIDLGLISRDQKDNKKAIQWYTKAIEVNPGFSRAFFNRANAYFDTEEYEKSLADFEKKIELTLQSPDYYTSVAKSKIIELKKIIANQEYSIIRELVNNIKALLLFRDGCITHYTSLTAAKAMIIGNSFFRLSEGSFLNDTSEGRELYKFLPPLFPTANNKDTIAEPFAPKPFIGSFVPETKYDDLILWRMYGKENMEEAKGCAITIKMNHLVENILIELVPDAKADTSSRVQEEFQFYRVAYRKEGKQDSFVIPGANRKQEKNLNAYMKDLKGKVQAFLAKRKTNIADIQNLLELLNGIAYLFKSAEYQYEHELRLIIQGIGFVKTVDSSRTPPRVYIELTSIRPVIHKITLGPKVEKPDEWASAFYYNLEKDSYKPEILISHLPFK